MGCIGLPAPDAPAWRCLPAPPRHLSPAGKTLRMGCRHGPAHRPTGDSAPCDGAGLVTTNSGFCNTATTDPANHSDTRPATDGAAIYLNPRHTSVTRISSPYSTEAGTPGPRGRSRPNRGRQTLDATNSAGAGPVYARPNYPAILQTDADSHACRGQTGAGS